MTKQTAALRKAIPPFLQSFYDKHEVYPSVEDIAKYLKRTKSTAFYHLHRLREEKIVRLLGTHGGWRPT